MTKLNELYKCNVCGNMVKVVNAGDGTLVCCGQPMVLQKTPTEMNSQGNPTTHQPVIEIKGQKEIHVKIGEEPHPMTKEHYIQWIELSVDGLLYTASLNPWDKPEATFRIPVGKKIVARAKCNIHGIWKTVLE